MSATDSILGPLSESLVAIAHQQDSVSLFHHLQGRGLPALGGDSDPSEVILRSLGESGRSGLAASLAPVLAQVIDREAAALKEEPLTPVRELSLLNALRLAADLPAEIALANSLRRLASVLEEAVPDFWSQTPLAPPLARALVHQQPDGRSAPLWLRLLERSGEGSWTPEWRTILLAAWRGLLYVPPDAEAERAGRVIDFDRIERGLLLLSSGAWSHEDGPRLVRQALRVMTETFPRSPQFWEERWAHRIRRWPVELRAEAIRQWPGLEQQNDRAEVAALTASSIADKVREVARKAKDAVKEEVEAQNLKRPELKVGMTVEGLVTTVNKGGVEVEVMDLRAFCPVSQLDLRYVVDPNQFIGRRLAFRVIRVEPGRGRSYIFLSRRALLEEEAEARAVQTRKRLQVGSILTGKVTSLTSYGAFVDLGGLEGMLHVSEIGYSRLSHPRETLQIGEEIEVQVIKIEKGKDEKRPRISLSRRSLERDPWADVADLFSEGDEITGRVVRVEAFGAFVEIAPGVEGLVHISEMGQSRRLQHARDAAEPGQRVQVRVLGVDSAKRRISLSMALGGFDGKKWNRAHESHDEAAVAASYGASTGSGLASIGDLHAFRESKR